MSILPEELVPLCGGGKQASGLKVKGTRRFGDRGLGEWGGVAATAGLSAAW